jgi:hypothetical protein
MSNLAGVGRVAEMRPNQLPGGGFSIARANRLDRSAPADLYLISTHEPRGETAPSDNMPVGELRDSLRRVLDADLAFTEATDIRSTVGNSRQAGSYRVGRVFSPATPHTFSTRGARR